MQPDVDVPSWVDRYGLPLAFLLLVVLAIFKAVAALVPWMKELLTTLAERHLKYLDETSKSQDRMCLLMEQQSEMIRTIHGYAQGLAQGDQKDHWDGRFNTLEGRLEELRKLKP